ncbi:MULTISPECIES: hypothetical protein [Mycobacteroides]|uniref:Uncharacterized protein n=3 Tax=Mycobacteriaceae TaxID=1762 RepID=A0A7V8RWK8_9MYCO|nr:MULTISPECIES: hypothetical protein [Mycobacteroides]OHT49655.1 hypothetical protein BKG62_19045 [Mycobacteroides chelonae]AMT69212.1 hypothetical protein ABG82_01365 [Mycobacteroides immunogenum]ANO02239.1 hypothetical protein BAB75_01365 [Mycobacteroides immunogenum]KIU40602.1 hypothetical protein TL11_10105 [Mycobacteroides immunogenum]KPG11269.1 hypothetical protein AN908_12905 [Mycobacteroides immunogenum]
MALAMTRVEKLLTVGPCVGDEELLAELTPEHLRAALRHKRTRTRYGWALGEPLRWWAQHEATLTLVRLDTLAAMVVLADSLTYLPCDDRAFRTDVQELVDDAVATVTRVEELLRRGYPAQWATKMARSVAGIELPELVVSEMVRRVTPSTIGQNSWHATPSMREQSVWYAHRLEDDDEYVGWTCGRLCD